MKKEIEILLIKYGSLDDVAKILGITRRHLNNVLVGKKTGDSLIKLIKLKARLVGIEDL